MGAGASGFDKSSQLTLSHEQRRRYKALYEDLIASGMPVDEVKQQIQATYDNERDMLDIGGPGNSSVLGGTKSARRPSLDKLTGETQKTGSGKAAPVSARYNEGSSVRRRTFDSNPSEPILPRAKDAKKQSEKEANSRRRREIDAATRALLTSPSESHILTSKAVSMLNDVKKKLMMTSTEGIAATNSSEAGGQCYFCELCGISCRTAAALEQHVKFSYVHTKALAEQESISDLVERSARLATVLHRCLEIIKFGSRRAAIVAQGRNRACMRWKWAFRKVRFENDVLRTANYLARDLAQRKRLESAGSTSSTTIPTTKRLDVTIPAAAPPKLSSCNLLLENTKFFWKGHETLEIRLYLHNNLLRAAPMEMNNNSNNNNANGKGTGTGTKTLLGGWTWDRDSVLEVIAFDGHKHKELNRLYFTFAEVYMCAENDIRAETEKYQAEQARKQKEAATLNNYLGESLSSRTGSLSSRGGAGGGGGPSGGNSLKLPGQQSQQQYVRQRRDVAYLRDNGEVDVAVLAEFVLSKLELTPSLSDNSQQLLFAAEGLGLSPLSGKVDTLLTPAVIHRRRKSTEAEIHSVMSAIRSNAENLKALTKAAGSAVGIASSPVGKVNPNPSTKQALQQSLSIKMAVLDNAAVLRASKDSAFEEEWDDDPDLFEPGPPSVEMME